MPSWKVSQTRGRLDAGPDAAPEGGVEQDDVDRRIEHVGGELLEIDDHRVGGERHADLLAHAAHAVQAPGRVLEVVVAQILDGPAEADRLLDGEGGVGIVSAGRPPGSASASAR